MLRRALAALASSAALAAATAAQAANPAATVQLADGDVRIATAGADPRMAKVGDIVSEGDTLITGKDGEVHLAMQDSGFMVVRPNTSFQVVAYISDGDDKDKGIFRLLNGGVRSITGWIGKFNARNYKIQTTNATVGIRGTDHETRYIPEGSSEGEPGTYDRVYAGETYMETPDGQATIAQDQSGFQSVRPREKPRRLAAIPAFYRPGPHEAQVARKHAEIQRLVAERREERRKVMRERKAAVGDLKAKAAEGRAQGKEIPEEQKAELVAKRDALKRDARHAREMHADIQKSRKAIEEDAKAGRITRAQLREKRKALNDRERSYDQLQASINQRLKELNETADSILR